MDIQAFLKTVTVRCEQDEGAGFYTAVSDHCKGEGSGWHVADAIDELVTHWRGCEPSGAEYAAIEECVEKTAYRRVYVATAGDRGCRGPLLDAAFDGNFERLEHLLEQGHDVNERGEAGVTALMRAAGHGGRLSVVKLLVDRGADVEAKTIYGATALHGAAMRGHLAVVQYLVEECGADVTVRAHHDEGCWNARDHAAQNNHTAVMDYLKSKGG